MSYFKHYSPFIKLAYFSLLVNFILRIVLMFHPITQSDFSILQIVKIFGFGLINDIAFFIVIGVFLWLYLLFLSDSKYNKPWGYVIFGVLLIVLVYISFFNTILNEYGGSLPEVVISFVAIKTLFFGLLLFLPKYRNAIRKALFFITVFIYVLLIVQNAVSEFFFWNEFGVRYNFIAVDYLVYTNTVIGNIMESYPVVPLFLTVGLVAFTITYFIVKQSRPFLRHLPDLSTKLKGAVLYVVLFFLSLQLIPAMAQRESDTNVFANELQANGAYKFYSAFMSNELDYDTYYPSIPKSEAFTVLQNQLPGSKNESTLRTLQNDSAEIRKNVVLITVESLSEDFMTEFGNEKHITPFLDSLAQHSMQFTNLYAVGNRTVRGLEAVTLCLPPSAAESVVKRKDNKNKFTTGAIFKQKGYAVKYMYGGDAYFDNMEDFFGGNGYDIIDKKTFQPNEISFSNIWGVCDEDMYRKAIREMNKEAAQNKPFFNHIMTVSNHRPFTYPEGKIDIPADKKSRSGGVKYTDYALGQFFKEAQKQPWFKETVFVILADHCASSSGKTELPLEKYRIPAMVYAPGFIQPKHVTTLMSQIDVMPTLFGLLNFSYDSKFYGQDIFDATYKPRAFVATYQDLGMIKDNVLTVLSPVKKVKQYQLTLEPKANVKPEFQSVYLEKPILKQQEDLINETIAYYQTSAYLLRHQKLNR
ncbi:LTA synthase family protein [Flavobacterium sp.]|uniref:LTA synthase family protein n=1 Tax=Flavobacterium sp. TaxID=239 RepID=UPI002FDDA37E